MNVCLCLVKVGSYVCSQNIQTFLVVSYLLRCYAKGSIADPTVLLMEHSYVFIVTLQTAAIKCQREQPGLDARRRHGHGGGDLSSTPQSRG